MDNNEGNKARFMLISAVMITILVVVVVGGIFFGQPFSSDKSDDYEVASSDAIAETTTAVKETSQMTVDELMEYVRYDILEPKKGQINLSATTDLALEVPEIDSYPAAIVGDGDIDIEIFSSGEKAGEGTDGWLVETAEKFNREHNTTSSGSSISMTVRSVTSGLSADYIISEKYLPDLYTPSNELFGDYAIANGGNLELYEPRLVGNTAGVLVKKGSEYKDFDSIIEAVQGGKYNFGYTNPQTSAAGLNLLIELLKQFGDGDMTSDAAVTAFSNFNDNIPFIAYTTQQMRDSASGGVLDGMVSEYQAYINNQDLTHLYDFIPFGQRHDNPLYIVGDHSDEELEAIGIVKDYLLSSESQQLATKYGYNANDDYTSSYTTDGTEVKMALDIYKKNKDAGKDIIAVFVADRSGSMDGYPIMQLKESLSNGMQYINDNNYIGMISYGSDITVDLEIAQFDLNQKAYFQGAIDNLSAGGNTYSYEAICVAIQMLDEWKASHPDAKFMIFLLSDGEANGGFGIGDVAYAIRQSGYPIYTVGYNDGSGIDELKDLSSINEAANISADSDDVVYQIKNLFNAQL